MFLSQMERLVEVFADFRNRTFRGDLEKDCDLLFES